MTVAMAFCMLFAFGTFSASADEVAETPEYSFTMNEKAQAKIIYEDNKVFVDGTEVKNAIRFVSQITKGAIDDIVKDHDVKVKTIIIKKDVLGDVAFTKASLDEAELKYQQVIFSEDKNLTDNESKDGKNYVFQACLYNVQDANYTADLCAVSYLEVDGVASEYTNVVTANLWDVANDARLYLDPNEDTKLDDAEKGSQEELDFVSTLCATYKVNVTGFDGEVATYKLNHGQYLTAEQISTELNVEGAAYFNGTIDGLDITKPIIANAEATASMNALAFNEVEGGYEVNIGTLTHEDTVNIVVPETYSGKSVVAIAKNGFALTVIKSFIAPDSVTVVNSDAFSQCYALEYAALPGWTSNVYDKTGLNHFLFCGNLETLILGESFTSNVQMFVAAEDQTAKKLDIYLSSADGTFASDGSAGLLSGNVYYYDANGSCGTWKYNEDKTDVILAPAHIFEDGLCKNCKILQTEGIIFELDETENTDIANGGNELTYGKYVVTGYTGTATEVYIPREYNGIEVVAIGKSAFLGKNITKVVAPTSVIAVGGDAFSQCYSLEYVALPGWTVNSYWDSINGRQEHNNQFCFCASIEVLILGGSFYSNVGIIPSNGSQTAKCNIYLTSAEGTVSGSVGDLWTQTIYYYSESEPTDTTKTYWHYDENGIATIWERQWYADANGAWINSKITAWGDSITYGEGVSDKTKLYTEVISERMNLTNKVNNQGVNGRQLIDEGVVEAIIESANSSDILIIALGTNDWGSDGGQLGAITDTDTATFYGALNTLKTAFDTTDIKVIFVTPLGRHQAEVNQHGGTLADFGQAIKNIFGNDDSGKYMVVDGFDVVSVNEIDVYAQDGLHVNEDGHELIAKAILNAMKNIFEIANN